MKRHARGRHLLQHVGGGDGMWIQACLGMQQCYSSIYCCPYCLVHKNCLHETTKSEPRTLEMAYRCTHTAELPFTCDGCHETFTTEAEVADSKPIGESANATYRRKHYGWNFGTAPCLDLEPIELLACSLHLKLAIGRKLFSYSVTECLNEKRADFPLLLSTLKNIGIKTEPGGTSTKDVKMALRTTLLGGAEVNAFFIHVDTILDILDPVVEHRQHVTTAVDHFYDVYEVLTDPKPITAIDRSQRVKHLGLVFFDHIKIWIGDGGINYYMHHLISHIPDQILSLPDNFPFQHVSAIALEAQNRLTKRALRQHSNYNPQTAAVQVLHRLTASRLNREQRRALSIQHTRRNRSRVENQKKNHPARRIRNLD